MRPREFALLTVIIAASAWWAAPVRNSPRRSQWDRSQVRVNGIALGTTLREARARLGPPKQPLRGELGELCWWPTQGQPTEVWFRRGEAVRISGPNLTFAGHKATLAELGPPQRLHHYGYFGSPVHCWEQRDYILELFSDPQGVAALNVVTLMDPTIPDAHSVELPGKRAGGT